MYSDLRILFYTNAPKHLGTRRLFFDNLARDFRALGMQVEQDDWKNIERCDVFISLSSDLLGVAARQRNPGIMVGIVHPSDINEDVARETGDADFIISGSIEERDYYLKYNANILLMPHIEADWGTIKHHSEKKEIVLGYHGNKQHLHQFYPHLTAAIEALASQYPIRLKAIYNIHDLGLWQIGRPAITVDDVQWEYETLASELITCDIGIVNALSPVPEIQRIRDVKEILDVPSYEFGAYRNDYILRFKNSTNAGRALVFIQLGIPVVADMTPECCQVIHHGRTGFLAQSAEGWYDAIEQLIRSSELRQAIANQALDHFKRFYNQQEHAQNLANRIAVLHALHKSGKLKKKVPIQNAQTLRVKYQQRGILKKVVSLITRS